MKPAARVAVTVDTRVDGPEGDYSARVIATSAGEALVSTAVGAHREEESYHLTVHHIGRNGQAADYAGGFIVGDFDRFFTVPYSTVRGTATYRLPRGRFSMATIVATARDDNPANDDVALMGTPAIDLTRDDRRVWIEIPTGFTEMQQRAPERALKWRLDLRQMFEAYFGRGYRAVDFVLQRDAGFGRYLLARGPG